MKLKGILLGLALIPVLFYTYSGAIGRSPDWLNIAIFFVSAAIAYVYETKQFQKENAACKAPRLALALLVIMAALFVWFTFAPPALGLFIDPRTPALL